MPKEKDIFLIARYYKKPRDPKQTAKKGYMKSDTNISYSESVSLSRGLKNKDITANIILNLTQKTVVKCSFETNNGWEELASYYAKNYPQYLKMEDPGPEPVEVVEPEVKKEPEETAD